MVSAVPGDEARGARTAAGNARGRAAREAGARPSPTRTAVAPSRRASRSTVAARVGFCGREVDVFLTSACDAARRGVVRRTSRRSETSNFGSIGAAAGPIVSVLATCAFLGGADGRVRVGDRSAGYETCGRGRDVVGWIPSASGGSPDGRARRRSDVRSRFGAADTFTAVRTGPARGAAVFGVSGVAHPSLNSCLPGGPQVVLDRAPDPCCGPESSRLVPRVLCVRHK